MGGEKRDQVAVAAAAVHAATAVAGVEVEEIRAFAAAAVSHAGRVQRLSRGSSAAGGWGCRQATRSGVQRTQAVARDSSCSGSGRGSGGVPCVTGGRARGLWCSGGVVLAVHTPSGFLVILPAAVLLLYGHSYPALWYSSP